MPTPKPEPIHAALALALCLGALASPLSGQRSGKQSARDLFYQEAGLVVSPDHSRKGRFGAAKKSTVAVALGLKYRLWKLAGGEAVETDPAASFQPGDQIRLGVEINDTGYLYVVHREASGRWRRLFPSPEIEHGNHFIHSGLTYPIPPEEGLELQFPHGEERTVLVLSRTPVKELDVLVGPRQPDNTVSALPVPEISDSVLEKVSSSLISKDLLTERVPSEKAVYVVDRSGRPESLLLAEIHLSR
jgi:hypothetical protein